MDIFYKDDIQHVAQINSEPNVIRGNHYHKETTQHMLIISGSMEYWYKNLDSNEKPKMVLLKRRSDIHTTFRNLHIKNWKRWK